jgi:hypothetical protein
MPRCPSCIRRPARVGRPLTPLTLAEKQLAPRAMLDEVLNRVRNGHAGFNRGEKLSNSLDTSQDANGADVLAAYTSGHVT